ncbi:MAG: hypothetical protein DRQ40_08920 [Gammaproteobacteria bacterium]|nr:MAG: hypothetical protein DRQ40_08920 [Gammaproteobacteria bacterium]
MATNRAQKHRGRDVAPKVLGDFVKALAHLKDKGRPLTKLFEDAIEEHGILRVLDVVHKYNPKSIDAEITTKSIEDFVTGTVQSQTNDSTQEANLH